MRNLLDRWKGIALAAIGVVATVWLAATGRLGLYIHPRYFVFTVVMAVVAFVLIVAAFAILPTSSRADDTAHDGHDDDVDRDGHDHHAHDVADEPRLPRSPKRALGTTAAVVILVVSAIALLALPPATLTTATASQRELNSNVTTGTGDSPALVGGDPASFTVKDWALLVAGANDAASLPAASAELTGFVFPSTDDPDVFYVSRFTVTCCAVDAQPFGVPVSLPGWQDQFAADDWVRVAGSFSDDADSGAPVLVPDSVEPVEEPPDPYVY